MITIQDVQHNYKERCALQGISLEIQKGEIFGLLGPNGSGKTTLFRLLTTAMELQSGSIQLGSLNLSTEATKVRQKLGVVFQSPSLDAQLSVSENLKFQASFYGLSKSEAQSRTKEMLSKFAITDRAKDIVKNLSGGLKRRVELAKALLHRPEILILDEPSTGLDPGARSDLWKHLHGLKSEGVTILVTTHLMEEAEKCNRLAILNEGKVVCVGTPEDLKKEIRKDVLVVKGHEGNGSMSVLANKIREKFDVESLVVNGSLQIEQESGSKLVSKLMEAFPEDVESVTFRRPGLEDVFLHHTGHIFSEEKEAMS